MAWLLLIAVILIIALVHELTHVLVARMFGYRPLAWGLVVGGAFIIFDDTFEPDWPRFYWPMQLVVPWLATAALLPLAWLVGFRGGRVDSDLPDVPGSLPPRQRERESGRPDAGPGDAARGYPRGRHDTVGQEITPEPWRPAYLYPLWAGSAAASIRRTSQLDLETGQAAAQDRPMALVALSTQ